MKAEDLKLQTNKPYGKTKKRIGFFEKYLTLWVALCIGAGIGIGHFAGDSIQVLSNLEGFRVNLPVAVLIKSGLSKEVFIATGVIIASPVEIKRLSVYASRFTS
jgi:hypothetical protein